MNQKSRPYSFSTSSLTNTLASVSDDPVPLGDNSVFDFSASITGYFLSYASFRVALNKSMSSVVQATNAIYRPVRGVNTLARSDAAFAGCDTSACALHYIIEMAAALVPSE